MKKWLKILLKTIAYISLVLILVVLFSVEKIDTDPYFESDYYKKSISEIDLQAKNNHKVEDSLMVGFASINITPKIVLGKEDFTKGQFNAIRLAGYGDGQMATGIHDSLNAKAIAIQVKGKTIVLVSADLLEIPETVVLKTEKLLKGKTNIKRPQLFFGATHTHASIGNLTPGFIAKQFGGEYQENVVDWLSQKFMLLILNAEADLRKGSFAMGHKKVPELIRNRIIGETGRLHDQLDVIAFKQDKGKKAIIGIYGAHATTVSSWNSEFSADYPGQYQKKLEQNGWDMALFFAGTVGSHSNKGSGERFKKIQYIGESLAEETIAVSENFQYSKYVSFNNLSASIAIPKLQAIKITDQYRLAPWLAKKIMPEITNTYIQGFKLNSLIWLTSPVELSGELNIDFNNTLENNGYNSVITSFNGQYLGYCVPGKYYYYDTYEAALMGWYGPSMSDYMMELNYKIANLLTNNRL